MACIKWLVKNLQKQLFDMILMYKIIVLFVFLFVGGCASKNVKTLNELSIFPTYFEIGEIKPSGAWVEELRKDNNKSSLPGLIKRYRSFFHENMGKSFQNSGWNVTFNREGAHVIATVEIINFKISSPDFSSGVGNYSASLKTNSGSAHYFIRLSTRDGRELANLDGFYVAPNSVGPRINLSSRSLNYSSFNKAIKKLAADMTHLPLKLENK